MGQLTISRVNIVLANEIVTGSLAIENNHIVDIDLSPSHRPGALDWEHDFLIPGLVELHTDNMEKYFAPRPGVMWPSLPAMLAHDTQMAASGVTTVFDAVAVGYDIHHSNRTEILDNIITSIDYIKSHELCRADHYLHLRCELSCDSTSAEFDQYVENPHLRLVSLMDHAPGQRQFARLEKYREYYQKKYAYSDNEMEAFIERHKTSSDTWSHLHRRHIARTCSELGIPMASHDDATLEHVRESLDNEVSIAEFPTTLEAARLSHDNDLKVLMGAPNLVRGFSHSGNVAASLLAQEGCLDILSSDYYPSSLLHSAFVLAELDMGYDLPQALCCVSKNPANAVGLHDRGSIEIGNKADILRVGMHHNYPVIREVWKNGLRTI